MAIIEAPSVLGLRPSGVQDLPAALLDAGLLDHPGALHAGRVEAPAYDPGGTLTPGSSTPPASRGTPSGWPTR